MVAAQATLSRFATMNDTSREELLAELGDFWLRSYERDVTLLNEALRKPLARTAGFESAPPSILTGDPFSLTPGDCFVVLGLNPHWRTGGLEGEWARHDVLPSIRDHEHLDFERYRARRAGFFEPGNPQYNKHHFSKLGNRLGRCLCNPQIDDAKDVFRRKVLMLDLLPWWSRDTKCIDPQRLNSDIEPLILWKDIIQKFIGILRPTAIIVNGASMRAFAASFLGTKLQRFDYCDENQRDGVAYRGSTQFGIPSSFMHKSAPIPGHATISHTRRSSPHGEHRNHRS